MPCADEMVADGAVAAAASVDGHAVWAGSARASVPRGARVHPAFELVQFATVAGLVRDVVRALLGVQASGGESSFRNAEGRGRSGEVQRRRSGCYGGRGGGRARRGNRPPRVVATRTVGGGSRGDVRVAEKEALEQDERVHGGGGLAGGGAFNRWNNPRSARRGHESHHEDGGDARLRGVAVEEEHDEEE